MTRPLLLYSFINLFEENACKTTAKTLTEKIIYFFSSPKTDGKTMVCIPVNIFWSEVGSILKNVNCMQIIYIFEMT